VTQVRPGLEVADATGGGEPRRRGSRRHRDALRVARVRRSAPSWSRSRTWRGAPSRRASASKIFAGLWDDGSDAAAVAAPVRLPADEIKTGQSEVVTLVSSAAKFVHTGLRALRAGGR
jgi:hypothetical protein